MNQNLELPVYLFHQGTATKAYELMGAHPFSKDGLSGYLFRVWAPKARNVYVTGEFNHWSQTEHKMKKITEQGIWQLFIPGIEEYSLYKYVIEDKSGSFLTKTDPYGFHSETRPGTASKTYDLSHYQWKDAEWQSRSGQPSSYQSPMNIYEVHFGSWRKYADGNYFNYEKLAEELIPYVKEMGYTHLELMPISEYPFDNSWGYQVTGYYAPTSRFGTPDGFRSFVDACHKAGLAVILDWVPGHFPKDAEGLYRFDGSNCCYEYEDPYKNQHLEWGTMVFDWGRNEVRSFLISNALFWFELYHIDGLRVDAVASMLYLDYGRPQGKWRPNCKGGRENLEAVSFLQDLNKAVFQSFPNALMIAEESTAWPMVTGPVHDGGLGFNYKWNMGWMNDSLEYMKQDPLFRKGSHHKLTFPLTYFHTENYILPLSHDEVVHMKGSLINKMPGSYQEKFDGLRAYMAYMIAHPGKKLLFMGGEFAQFSEWHFESELDWSVLEFDMHRKFHGFIRDLNHFYLEHSELWELDFGWEGFQWMNPDDHLNNMISFRRINQKGAEYIIISNFSPVARNKYRIGVPKKGMYQLVFSTGFNRYGGTEEDVFTEAEAEKKKMDGFDYSIEIDLPGLSTTFWR